MIPYDPSACNSFKCDLIQAIYGALALRGMILCSLSLESATPGKTNRYSQCAFLKIPPLGVKMRLNYQDPDGGVLSYSGYGARIRYIYIYHC